MITSYEAQRETNIVMLKLAHDLKVPVIITCDVHYAKPPHGLAQNCLLLMRDKKTIKDKVAGEGVWQFEAKDLWWKSLEEVMGCWRDLHSDYFPKTDFLQAVRNT